MKLSVGDVVVHRAHGVGRVAARGKRVLVGAMREVVVIELPGGLTVTLPLDRARLKLRPLASKAEMRRVREALRADRVLSPDPWLSRRGRTLAKLTGGDPVDLAEIVGDGAQRERARQARGARPQLSPGERDVFVKAWNLLAEEVARTQGLDQTAAEGWIAEQLARPGALSDAAE